MRRYKAKEFSDEALSEMGARVRDLLQTMLNNATRAKSLRICRVAQTTNVDARFLPLIRKMFSDRSLAMLSGVQEELNSFRWKRSDSASPRVRIGLTIFSHEDWPEDDKTNDVWGRELASNEQPHESRRRVKHGTR
jgi:hypothetical protein